MGFCRSLYKGRGVSQMGLKLFARLLLLVAGLGYLIPGVLAPIMTLGVGQITVQLVIGALSVILALYLIIKKVP